MKLEELKDPSMIKNYSKKDLEQLASDIRRFLIEKLSVTGGHLGQISG